MITGGSRGIGAATASKLASQGWDVALTYRSDAAAAESVADSCRSLGQRAIAFAGDVTSDEDVVRVFEQLDEKLGRLSALVNNAGIVDGKARVD